MPPSLQRRPAVAPHYRFIAYTHRYFGSQALLGDGKNFSQAKDAADVIAFIKGINVGPVHVVA